MLHFLLAAVLAQPQPALPAEVMAAITPQNCRATVDTLAGFGTRHTLSDTTSPTRGIGAAREWIKARFTSFGLDARLEPFDAPKGPRMPEGGRIVNVVAIMPGTDPTRAYYVVGHYDTINADRMDPTADAPGANDDASGTTVVIECARALAGRKLESTIVFLCTAAEEQGLLGAKLHADAVAAAKPYRVLGVLSNDIVGDPSPPVHLLDGSAPDGAGFVRVFSEGLPRNSSAEELARIRQLGAESDSASRQLARYVRYIARLSRADTSPLLVFRQDRFLRGGDHSAFNEAGFAGVRFTVASEDYTRQHVNVTQKDGKPYGDLPEFVNAEYVAGVARLNAAVLVNLANAPTPPADVRMVTAQLETGTTLRWSKSPEADTAGYEVVWRFTTDPDWAGTFDAGDTTEWKSPASKDNYFFGVRAYDKDGYRSPVAFAGAAAK